MKEISTKQDLINYIRRQLGEPIIAVEVSNDHISDIIDDTLKMYTDFVYGFFEDFQLVKIKPLTSAETDVWDLSVGKTFRHFVEISDVQRSDTRKSVPFKWDSIKRKLQILASPEEIQTPALILRGLKPYVVDEDFDLIFNESWVKRMAKAKTQLLWGQILGKYSQSLVGSAEINFDRIISEAQSEIDKLEEELQERWEDPAPVFVG